MQFLYFLSVLAVLLSAYLVSLGLLPRIATYSPLLVGIFASVAVVMTVSRKEFPLIRPVYWVLGIAIVAHLTFGVIANDVQPGSIIVGGRLYLSAIPFFFLGLVISQTSRDFRRQLLLILALSVIQLPIAAYQRSKSLSAGLLSGDHTVGTLMSSGILSIFLICIACVIVTLHVRKKIGGMTAILLLIFILVPTMINETKITLILIPVAFLIPAFTAPGANRAKQAVNATVLMALFIAVFIPTYDHFIKAKWGYGLLEFLTMEGRVEEYLIKDSGVGAQEEIGRVDSLVLPVKILREDIVTSILGLGMGSVTYSSLGPEFSGQQFSRYGNLVGPTVSRLLWEVGWLGVLLIFALLYLIFRDALRLRKRDDAIGILAHVWVAIMPIMCLTLFYLPLMQAPALGTLFWFYSGVLVVNSSVTHSVDVAIATTPGSSNA